MLWCKWWCVLFPRDHRVHVHDPCAAVLWFVCHGCEIHFMAVDLKHKKVKAFQPAIVKVWFLVPWESADHSRVLEGQSYFFHNMSTLCIGLFHRVQFAWMVNNSVRVSTWMRTMILIYPSDHCIFTTVSFQACKSEKETELLWWTRRLLAFITVTLNRVAFWQRTFARKICCAEVQ